MSKNITYLNVSSIKDTLSYLAIALSVFIVIVAIHFNLYSNSQQLINENVLVVSRTILQQTAETASYLLESKDHKALKTLVNSSNNADVILEVVISDKNGQVIAKSDNAKSVKERFFEFNKETTQKQPVAFVKEITDINGALTGFVSATLLRQNLQYNSILFTEHMIIMSIYLVLLAMILGYLVAAIIKNFRRAAVLPT